jgi:tripartite-type tricarboxylate transporter receptor subunit TctC
MAGIDMVHVPYKGGAPALTEVIGGQIQMIVQTLLQAQPHIRSGRLRALAVTSATRARAAPDRPTMAEAGLPGYEVTGWYGVIAPPRTPAWIVARLNTDIVAALNAPDVRERLAADGSEVVGSTPAAFGSHIKTEVAKWSRVSRQAGVRAD